MISDQTVGNILHRHALPPARKRTTTWPDFIRRPAPLKAIKTELRERMDGPVAETGAWVKRCYEGI